MITKILLVLKKHILSISILYTLFLTFVSLIKLEDIPVPSEGDKVFHFFAYTILAMLWFFVLNRTLNFKKTNALLISAISAIIFGIIIEILQGTVTVDRSLDVNDIIANSLGVFIATVFILIKPKTEVKK